MYCITASITYHAGSRGWTGLDGTSPGSATTLNNICCSSACNPLACQSLSACRLLIWQKLLMPFSHSSSPPCLYVGALDVCIIRMYVCMYVCMCVRMYMRVYACARVRVLLGSPV